MLGDPEIGYTETHQVLVSVGYGVGPEIAERLEGVTIHDLRMVQGPTHTNLVFDAVVPYGFNRTHAQVKEEIEKIVQETWENYYAVIQVEQSYI